MLITPGENACRFKDSSDRLPLHIAAENGASANILQPLVNSYTDGCYRQSNDGDLPLHLLERSGKATRSSLELLIRPIMGNESICKIEGSQGCDLPLHIAARYRCSYEVLEKLLRTYSDAAGQLCKREEYMNFSALYLFEEGKPLGITIGTKDQMGNDFYGRSDLLFVYNPMISPPQSGDESTKDAAQDFKASLFDN